MSNKAEMMKKDSKRILIPKRRFPEFRDAPEWLEIPLGEMSDRIVEKVGEAALTPVSITAGQGFVSQVEKFGRDISGVQYRNYILLRHGDFAYNKGNSKSYPQGCVVRLKEFDHAAAPSAFISFRLHDGYAPEFFEGLFEKNAHGQQLIKFITSSARSNGLLNIRPDEFFSVNLPTPQGLAEQQKIAECLSSFDGLITAEGRKLEALRDHKRGLMQHFFPQPGQTQPRLRFPEFRNHQQQRFELVADFAKVTTGNKDTQNKVDTGLYPFFVRSQNVERINSYSYDGEAVLTSGDGVGVGENYHYISGKFDYHQRVYCIYGFSDKVNGQFFFYYFSQHFKVRVKQMSAKNSVDSVRMSMITDMPIWVPTLEEQHRIAGCLSALDTQITAQAAKIESLKQHKRGLMQQLFPAPEEQ